MDREKLKRKLINKHLEGWNLGLSNLSIEHYANTGKLSGSLFVAVKDMMDEYVKEISDECVHPYSSVIGEEHGLPECLSCGKKLY